jgi:hypothetical protein
MISIDILQEEIEQRQSGTKKQNKNESLRRETSLAAVELLNGRKCTLTGHCSTLQGQLRMKYTSRRQQHGTEK